MTGPTQLTARLMAELAQEAGTTRRLLERVPEAHLTWKPHPKSMTLGQLAAHIANLPRGITDLALKLETEAPVVPLPGDLSLPEILGILEQSVATAAERLAAWGDEGLAQTWRLTRGGQTVFEMPRAAVIRTILLNHWYHHRGQLTVYLRLLDVPLPSVYGPTADEP